MTEKRKRQYQKLSLNVSYYRKLKGISQLELAESVNLSRTHISNLEAVPISAIWKLPICRFLFHWKN